MTPGSVEGRAFWSFPLISEGCCKSAVQVLAIKRYTVSGQTLTRSGPSDAFIVKLSRSDGQ